MIIELQSLSDPCHSPRPPVASSKSSCFGKSFYMYYPAHVHACSEEFFLIMCYTACVLCDDANKTLLKSHEYWFQPISSSNGIYIRGNKVPMQHSVSYTASWNHGRSNSLGLNNIRKLLQLSQLCFSDPSVGWYGFASPSEDRADGRQDLASCIHASSNFWHQRFS